MKGDFTKAKAISQRTKRKVWERQKAKSIFSGKPITISECCCHFVPRSSSGVGYEWNIFGATFEEHKAFDEHRGINIGSNKVLSNDDAKKCLIRHMEENYEGWSLEKCKYKKFFEEKDYEVNGKN